MFIIQHLRKCCNINMAKKSEILIFCRNVTNQRNFLYDNYNAISDLYHICFITTAHILVFHPNPSISSITDVPSSGFHIDAPIPIHLLLSSVFRAYRPTACSTEENSLHKNRAGETWKNSHKQICTYQLF